MRLILSCLLISLLSINAYCQDSESEAFLHNFFGDSTKLVYMDKLWEGELKQMSRALAQDTLYTLGGKMNDPKNRLVLTQQERMYIQNELKLQADAVWPGQLFKYGKLLTQATLDSIYKDQVRSKTYFREHDGSRLYSFSKPIFIRDHSVCIFYSGYSCGSRCGEGKLVIFKRENAAWISWLELYRWIS